MEAGRITGSSTAYALRADPAVQRAFPRSVRMTPPCKGTISPQTPFNTALEKGR